MAEKERPTGCHGRKLWYENQRIYRSAEEIPQDAGYYSLIIAKEAEE